MVLWGVWVVLAVVWANTLAHLWLEGSRYYGLLALLVLISGIIIYWAEGLELAVAILLHARMVPDDIHALMAKMNSNVFFRQRQLIVIFLVTFSGVATVYPWLRIPGYGELAGAAPFWFSIAFPSLSIMWFSQIAPKLRAMAKPEHFVRSGGSIFRAVRLLNAVDLTGPSDDVFWFLSRGDIGDMKVRHGVLTKEEPSTGEAGSLSSLYRPVSLCTYLCAVCCPELWPYGASRELSNELCPCPECRGCFLGFNNSNEDLKFSTPIHGEKGGA